MGVEEIIGAARQRYVDFFSETKVSVTAMEADTVSELLISINNEGIPYPYRYIRADLVSKNGDGSLKINEIRVDSDETVEPTGFNFGPFQVEIYPFAWCSVQVLFDKEPPNVNQIEGWITRWLDIEDSWKGDIMGLSGAVHSFSPIETNGSWWFLTADFGTAPADALIEFIELLASQGMSRIILKAG